MRLEPISPETLSPELRYVHDEIAKLVTRSQGQVVMTDSKGALTGPFTPMLHFPQFGVPALNFLRSLDNNARLDNKVREVAILTVGAAFGARFELYAHEIMAEVFGLSSSLVSTLAAGSRPKELSEQEAVAYDVAYALSNGRILPDSTYKNALQLLGKDGIGELLFLIAGYCLIAMVLNGFDVPAPEYKESN
jgi:4-carboxymuconolactone decarboxylase